MSNTAVTLLSLLAGSALHADTKVVLVGVETAALRYTVNGTTPTTTKGFNGVAGAFIRLTRQEADVVQLIRATGTDADLQVSQYKD